MPVWGVVNQKGGVGKTTTTLNLAVALHGLGARVLVVDCDPQGNATTGLGVRPGLGSGSLFDLIRASAEGDLEADEVRRCVVTTQDGPDLLPANLDLAGAETVLLNAIGKETVLREVIGRFRGQYDWILLDAPPSLGILTINILAASDALCVPMQCEYYALEGLSQLIKTVELVRRRIHPPLTIATVVLTMHDPRSRLTAEVEAEVRKFFGDKVAETRIPRNVRLSEAPGHGKSAVALFPQSKGAEAYAEFAQEVVALAASGAR